MAFTTDESNLNGINMDLINQYSQYVNALQPLMLQQSGYQKNISDTNISQATKDKIAKTQSDLATYNAARAGARPDLNNEFSRIIQEQYGANPSNAKQWNDADASIRNKLTQQLSSLQNQANNEKVSYDMTPEAKAAQDSYKALAATQLQQLQQQSAYLNSDAYKAQVAQQQQLSDMQQKNALAMQQRQQDALSGKTGTSAVLQKQITDSFQQFKEAQAREGNTIVGDSVDNAVGKGSAAIESLSAFKNDVNASKQRELDSIINQTPLTLASSSAASGAFNGLNLGNTGQFASTTFNQAYGTPQMPNYGGLSGLTLQAQQPYQNQAQLFMQQQQMQMQQDQANQSRQSGLLAGGMQLAGTIGGAFIGGPAGAAMGSQLGSSLGQQFYSPNPSSGYSPQFGSVYSPGSGQLG